MRIGVEWTSAWLEFPVEEGREVREDVQIRLGYFIKTARVSVAKKSSVVEYSLDAKDVRV